MRFTTARVYGLVQLLTISTLCTAARAQVPGTGTFDPLLRHRASLLTGQSRVVVVARHASSLGAVTQLIQLFSGALGRPLPLINGRAATVPNVSLMALAGNAAVQHIALDRLIVGAMERTGQTTATAVRQELGLDGSGLGVAVIDSRSGGRGQHVAARRSVRKLRRRFGHAVRRVRPRPACRVLQTSSGARCAAARIFRAAHRGAAAMWGVRLSYGERMTTEPSWGTTDDETVMWGTTDDETIVWGTSCTDSNCEPVVWSDS